MPRLRSVTPPPRRPAGSDRQPRKRSVTVKAKPIEEILITKTSVGNSKQDLIRQHAEHRAKRQTSGSSLFVISAAVVTCLAIGVGWWLSLGVGKTPDESLSPKVASVEPIQTSVDRSSSSTLPLVLPPLETISTTTERKLLVPLSSTSSPRTR